MESFQVETSLEIGFPLPLWNSLERQPHSNGVIPHPLRNSKGRENDQVMTVRVRKQTLKQWVMIFILVLL